VGVLGLIQKIHLKVPPILGAAEGVVVEVGVVFVVVADVVVVVVVVVVVDVVVVVADEVVVVVFVVVVDDVDPQLMTNEVQITRIVMIMSIFFTAFPPFLFALDFINPVQTCFEKWSSKLPNSQS
jgi:hypothetical protein